MEVEREILQRYNGSLQVSKSPCLQKISAKGKRGRRMTENLNGYAHCKRTECFAYRGTWYRQKKVCTILYDNNFGERSCPFFKTIERYTDDAILYKPKNPRYRSAYMQKKSGRRE